MTIRTGRLHRPCDKCGKYFVPATRHTRLCPECRGMSEWLAKLARLKAKNNPETKKHQKIIKLSKMEKNYEKSL